MAASERETEDTWTLTLEPLAGDRLACSPGQFTMLYAFGAGEVPISVSGGVGDSALVHTVRAVGATTRAITGLREGDQLGVRGPFGRGWPTLGGGEIPEGEQLLIVAGGLGLAPLRPSIYEALAERTRIGRLTLLYGGRQPDQLVFRRQLRAWIEREDIDCELTVDIADASWPGSVGVVPALIERLELDPERTTALICGPEIMMRFTAEALLGHGLAAERLFVSMERNMRCAVGHCGHCQWGGSFICRDGPVFDWAEIADRIEVREL